MLKLTKKADYGLIALRHLALAAHTPRGNASAKDIAEAYGIPLPLLSKVLQKLAKGGLLASEQGTNGGYRLARDAASISALEAIRTIAEVELIQYVMIRVLDSSKSCLPHLFFHRTRL